MTIWKLRNNNPLRKSYVTNNIKLNEFDALIRITVEMSKYLYPYIREILKSKEDVEKNSVVWNDFNKRFTDLVYERFNTNSIRVKKLLNQTGNDEILIKSLLVLSLCISNQGFQKLKNYLLYYLSNSIHCCCLYIYPRPHHTTTFFHTSVSGSYSMSTKCKSSTFLMNQSFVGRYMAEPSDVSL